MLTCDLMNFHEPDRHIADSLRRRYVDPVYDGKFLMDVGFEQKAYACGLKRCESFHQDSSVFLSVGIRWPCDNDHGNLIS